MKDKKRKQATKTMAVNNSNETQSIDVHVNPEEDDLDNDTGTSTYGLSAKKGSKKTYKNSNMALSLTQSANKCQLANDEKTPSNKVNKAAVSTTKKQSVAKRLDMLPPPTFNRPPPTGDDPMYIAENNRVDTLLQAEKEKLARIQREPDITRKELEAETTRWKALELEKQLQKDRKKMDQEKARYERETNKTNKNSKSRKSKMQHDDIQQSADMWENCNEDPHEAQLGDNEPLITTQRVKALNPLRHARLKLAGTDGSNNPNIPGANNGMNAWVDVAMHGKELDREVIYDVRYAKHNTDNSMFYDIDDVPTRGPPKIPDLGTDRSMEELTETAKKLLNDQHVSICRNTGIMKSTVSIPTDTGRQK